MSLTVAFRNFIVTLAFRNFVVKHLLLQMDTSLMGGWVFQRNVHWMFLMASCEYGHFRF